MPRFHLSAIGVDIAPKYVNSDLSALLNISHKLAPAAGVEIGAYFAIPENIRKQTRVIWTTDPSHLCEGLKNLPFVFSLHRRIPEADRQKIIANLVRFEDHKVLERLGFSRIERADASAWKRFLPRAKKLFSAHIQTGS